MLMAARLLCFAALLPLVGSFSAASPLLVRSFPAAALAAVPFSPQLEVRRPPTPLPPQTPLNKVHRGPAPL